MSRLLPRQFYEQKTLRVARDLLGCFLVRKMGRHVRYFMITETEAYNGPLDRASHASRGMTERNRPMFSSAGTIYVYFTYGMHYMFNIATEAEGYPAAVLIRSIAPLGPDTPLPRTNGPARLTKALGIDKRFNNRLIDDKKTGLWIESGHQGKHKIFQGKRIGIDYAGEYKDKLWRYYIAAS